MENAKKTRILCFGDSLTEGWYMNGKQFHPYSRKLEKLFKQNRNQEVEIINKGKSSECVYPEMLERLQSLLEMEPPFDLVIILGGTNDLAFLSKAKEVDLFLQIKTLHEIAHNSGAKTCALTMPQSSFDMIPSPEIADYLNYREEVNKKIREFVATNNDNLCLCDLSIKLPMYGINNYDLQKYWDDELHFTPQGYDKMAEIIYQTIQDFI